MIVLLSGADPNSLEIKRDSRDGQHVGYINWHCGREPYLRMVEDAYLTVLELEEAISVYRDHRRRLGSATNLVVRINANK